MRQPETKAGERSPQARRAAILPAALFGVVLVLVATRPYPGVTVDSGEYLAVAEGLAEGHGFTMPYVGYDEAFRVLEPGERVEMTQFPPLYPLLLAVVAALPGVSLLGAVTVLGSIVYASTLALSLTALRRATEGLLPVVVGGALLLAPDMLTPHAMAWSEPAMIFGLVGAVYLAHRYLATGSLGFLAGAAACAALASSARFAGIAVIAGLALVVVLDRRVSVRARIVRAATVATLASIPAAAWFLKNALVSGAVSEKEPTWHPVSWRTFRQGIETVGGWIVPHRGTAFVVGIVVLVLGTVVAVRALARVVRTGTTSLADVCLVLGASYTLFLVASRTVLDQNIPFDPRILAPLYALVVIGVCSRVPWGRMGTAALAVVATLALVLGVSTALRFSDLSVAWFSNEQWRASPTLAYAGELPPATRVVTNAPDPLWLWHDLEPILLPPRSSLYSGEPNLNYSGELHDVLRVTGCDEAVVVFFESPTRKPPRVIDPVVILELGLEEIETFSDGAAYSVTPPGRCSTES